MEKRKTVKQIIAEINENKKYLFDFEGFNQKKHDELVKELCYAIMHKFESRQFSQEKREKIACKTIPDLKAYYILKYGMERNETMEEMYNTEEHLKMVMPSKEEYKQRMDRVYKLLCEQQIKGIIHGRQRSKSYLSILLKTKTYIQI